jgi:hypothetical protein
LSAGLGTVVACGTWLRAMSRAGTESRASRRRGDPTHRCDACAHCPRRCRAVWQRGRGGAGGLDHAQGGVGDECVIPVGGEQLALLGAIATSGGSPFDAGHDQPARGVLALPPGGERDGAYLGDLRVADLPLARLPPRLRLGT